MEEDTKQTPEEQKDIKQEDTVKISDSDKFFSSMLGLQIEEEEEKGKEETPEETKEEDETKRETEKTESEEEEKIGDDDITEEDLEIAEAIYDLENEDKKKDEEEEQDPEKEKLKLELETIKLQSAIEKELNKHNDKEKEIIEKYLVKIIESPAFDKISGSPEEKAEKMFKLAQLKAGDKLKEVVKEEEGKKKETTKKIKNIASGEEGNQEVNELAVLRKKAQEGDLEAKDKLAEILTTKIYNTE